MNKYENVEKSRKKYRRYTVFLYLGTTLILILGVVLMLIQTYLFQGNFYYTIWGIILIFSALVFYWCIGFGFNKFYKSKILETIFEEVSEEIGYKDAKYNGGFFDFGVILNNPYFVSLQDYRFSDSYEGKIDNITFKSSDYWFSIKTTTDSLSSFNGKIIYFDLKDSSKFFNEINENSVIYFRFDKKKTFFGENNKLDELKKVEFESSEFNDRFDCFTNDEVFAYRVLTPATIIDILSLNKMLEMNFRFPNEKLHPTFVFYIMKNRIYIFIDLKAYENFIKLTKPVDEKTINKVKNDIRLPYDFYKALNLSSFTR